MAAAGGRRGASAIIAAMTDASPIAPTGWRNTVPPVLPSSHKYWLLRPGALTAGLRALGRMQLRVLREYASGLPADEAPALGLPARSPVWVREIVMSIDGVDCVAARSLTPLAASHGVWQGMRRLRTRPLADMLYHDRSIVRTPFAVARVRASMPLYRAVRLAWADAAAAVARGTLLARRSAFWRHGQPLLVAECFLPGFWALARRA